MASCCFFVFLFLCLYMASRCSKLLTPHCFVQSASRPDDTQQTAASRRRLSRHFLVNVNNPVCTVNILVSSNGGRWITQEHTSCTRPPSRSRSIVCLAHLHHFAPPLYTRTPLNVAEKISYRCNFSIIRSHDPLIFGSLFLANCARLCVVC